nr:trypsin eta-like [Maniola hyperantus]
MKFMCKMLSVRFGHVFVLTFLHCTYSERRLIGGEDVKTDKRYMAYLLQAKSSIRNYDAWICGGAIVSRWLMLTSAACVEDVRNIYAIAGTEMYVREDELEDNLCTSNWKRKVIYTCVPIAYDLQYDQVSKWSHNDVAVVKVEKPFVSSARSWRDCSYSPVAIPVNFDPKHEEPGTEAIVLGWGHTSKWRSTNSTLDLNQRQLQHVSVSVLDNEECKKSFTTPNMEKQIDDYMICSFHDGKLDETGKMIGSRRNTNE